MVSGQSLMTDARIINSSGSANVGVPGLGIDFIIEVTGLCFWERFVVSLSIF
jgi:hypothetical protein